MNLGDGLMFELENGKPKLIVTNYGPEAKISNKLSHRRKPQKVFLNFKQEPVLEKLSKEKKRTEHEEQLVKHGPQKTKVKRSAESYNHLVPRVWPVKKSECCKTSTTNKLTEGPQPPLKESLVCLTQEQLQQILSTIKTNSGPSAQDGPTQRVEGEEECPSNGTDNVIAEEAFLLDNNNLRHGSSRDKAREERMQLKGTQSGLFGTFGEREREREELEAKRAQWRRELDEQMKAKLQQKANFLQNDAQGGLSARAPSKTISGGRQVQEEGVGMPSIGPENVTGWPYASHPFSSQRDLPAAIRSAFVLGEATPVEHAFSAQRKEQQRSWLQALDQQREEAQQRRMQEKQYLSQAEDHERWAMHFDSLQKRPLSHPPPPASERGEPELPSSLSVHQRSASGALSGPWDSLSAFGGDSLGRASVDTTRGATQKSSYLRTMTALLDPAQIEERERRRIKQLEHQRAIEAQVEERRRRREGEEAARQSLEHEEERRVAREREQLQKQYMLDTQRHKQKEELHSRKTEELYLSVQRAQEEALKDKHLQRIRDLARKGHDVSKLLHSLETESSPSHALVCKEPANRPLFLASTEVTAQTMEVTDKAFSRKDTAVQTGSRRNPESWQVRLDLQNPLLTCNTFPVTLNPEVMPTNQSSTTEMLLDAHNATQTPDILIKHKTQPGTKKPKRDTHPADRNLGTGKENVCLNLGEGGEDLYEPYARTDKTRQQVGKRPEWNTHRRGKAFIPASERYPPGQQQHRQESRMRRQMELMTLVERNTMSRAPHEDHCLSPSTSVSQQQKRRNAPHKKDDRSQKEPSTTMATNNDNRVCSPPIPAVRQRLHQQVHQLPPASREEPVETTEWPPSSDYVPYVRTDEVYHLDPHAPLSRPPTQEPLLKTLTGMHGSRQATPVTHRDPLLHPELLKSTERQQAILKGLSELRQGLLQKQRELESSLNPLLHGQARNISPSFQHK